MPKKKPKVDWKGDEVFRATLRATQLAADETLALCVDDAKNNVPVVTAVLQGSLRLEPAEVKGSMVTGAFGSFDVNYALAVETGDRSLVGPQGAQTRESLPRSGKGKNTGNKNFLRNASDKEYPKFAGRIRNHYKKLGRV